LGRAGLAAEQRPLSYREFHPEEQCWHPSEEVIETTRPKGRSCFEFDD
jgi:hypothetical protein